MTTCHLYFAETFTPVASRFIQDIDVFQLSDLYYLTSDVYTKAIDDVSVLSLGFIDSLLQILESVTERDDETYHKEAVRKLRSK